MNDTIFALSSGAPPAAIGVIRVSGPQAGVALRTLTGKLPSPRQARLAQLRGGDGEVLDAALVLWLPGPGTETGEDVAELQCHGGRAVIGAVEAALGALPGLRRAGPGEFTRRAGDPTPGGGRSSRNSARISRSTRATRAGSTSTAFCISRAGRMM